MKKRTKTTKDLKPLKKHTHKKRQSKENLQNPKQSTQKSGLRRQGSSRNLHSLHSWRRYRRYDRSLHSWRRYDRSLHSWRRFDRRPQRGSPRRPNSSSYELGTFGRFSSLIFCFFSMSNSFFFHELATFGGFLEALRYLNPNTLAVGYPKPIKKPGKDHLTWPCIFDAIGFFLLSLPSAWKRKWPYLLRIYLASKNVQKPFWPQVERHRRETKFLIVLSNGSGSKPKVPF